MVKRYRPWGIQRKGGGAAPRGSIPVAILYLDGLDGVFDLEETALGREGVDTSVVFRSREEHCL